LPGGREMQHLLTDN
jgi:hypothetical protein